MLAARGELLVRRGRGDGTRAKDGQIHTDSKDKIITVLLYLNENWQQPGGRLRILRSGQNVDDFAAGRLAESFEVLLGNEFLVSQPLVHSVVPVLSTTQTSGGARAAPQSPARDAALDFGWRETVFGIIRWTFSTLAVLALAGVALVFAVPGLRRRLLYPDLPSLPAPAAAIAVGK